MHTRPATPDDADAMARVYNEGIADRSATFETRMRSAADVRAWFDGKHPIVVVEDGGEVVAFAALLESAERAGFWKLVSRVFPENQASRGLIRSVGFREVGIYEKHAKLDGAWRDVVIVERLVTRI
ncbi:MAG: GCN5-related N-acetyltransferase [Bryobacterales bacterium]|nr:GCN5-related N-acetyltransferase [Bryobacterales bacterium]